MLSVNPGYVYPVSAYPLSAIHLSGVRLFYHANLPCHWCHIIWLVICVVTVTRIRESRLFAGLKRRNKLLLCVVTDFVIWNRVSLGDLNVLHCFDWRTELWVCAERRFGTTGFYNPHSLPANSTMPFAVTYFNLQQLIFICSKLSLFAATYFDLQQLILICSNLF